MKKDTIDLEDLKTFIAQALDDLIMINKSKTLSIDTNRDNYWELTGAAMFEVETRPDVLDVGSLKDDVDFLKLAMSQRKGGMPPDIYSLVHAAPLLRYIAESHVKDA